MRRWGLLLAGLLLALAAASACGSTPAFITDVRTTSTIAVGLESRVVFRSPASIEVRGGTDPQNVYVTFQGTVSASTAEQSAAFAQDFEIVGVSDNQDLLIDILPPNGAIALVGKVTVEMPRSLRLAAQSSASGITVENIERALQLSAAGAVSVIGARDSIVIESGQGGVSVESSIPASTSLSASVGAGNIVYVLPASVSAVIALETGSGQIQIEHPGLPRPINPQSTSYRTTVRGGAASVAAFTQSGNVVVRSQ